MEDEGGDPDYVKLLDFGIARMINEGATRGLTREGEVFGTPHYMAPEQAQGKKEVGPPADIYAVGIMMWEMICGDCPFDAPTPLAVLFMHISDPLPPLRPKAGVVPTAQVEQIIRRACSKEPVDRYQTASEMLSDILSLIGSSTAALPGMIGTDASAEFGSGELRTRPSQVASRDPYFTPAPFATDVQVNDPDASHVESFDTSSQPAASNRRLLIVAAVAVVAVIGALGALFVIASADPSEAQAEVAEPAPVVPEPATATVAATEPEVIVEPIVVAKNPEEEVPVAAADPDADTAIAEPVEEQKPVEKEVVAEKPAPKKTVRKKPVRKPPKKVVAEPKDDEPTVTPGKWKPTVKPVTPTTWR